MAADPKLAPIPSLNDEITEKQRNSNELARSKAEIKAEFGQPPRRGLTHEIKSRMVELFAQFQSVSQVGDVLKSEYGLTLDRRTIEAFNPDSPRCRIGKRLISLFNSHRDAYIKECAKHGVAHQAHRLKLIGQIVDKATTAKDFANALKGLELAAKEMGGLSQKVEHTGTVSHVHGTVEEARRELADRLKALVPTIDLEPSHGTDEALEVECHGTEGTDNADAANMQTMPATALVTSTLPMGDSQREDSDDSG